MSSLTSRAQGACLVSRSYVKGRAATAPLGQPLWIAQLLQMPLEHCKCHTLLQIVYDPGYGCQVNDARRAT